MVIVTRKYAKSGLKYLETMLREIMVSPTCLCNIAGRGCLQCECLIIIWTFSYCSSPVTNTVSGLLCPGNLVSTDFFYH